MILLIKNAHKNKAGKVTDVPYMRWGCFACFLFLKLKQRTKTEGGADE